MNTASKGGREYIAILGLATGSSHARGGDPEDAIDRCGRIAVADWSSLFDLAGKEAKIGLYDVTGLGDLYWSGDYIPTDKESGAKGQLLEIRAVMLPRKRR